MAEPGDNLNQAGDDLTSKMEGLSASMKFTIANVDMLGERLNVSAKEFYSLVEASNQFEKSLAGNRNMMDKIVSGEMSLSKVKEAARISQDKRNKLLKHAENLQKKLSKMHQTGSKKQKKDLKDQISLLVNKAKTEKKHMDAALKTAQEGQGAFSSGFDKLGNFFEGKGLKSFGDKFKGVAKDARKAGIGTKSMAGFMFKFSGMAGKLAKANPFASILAMATAAVKKALEINAEVAVLGRSLGVSSKQASKVRQHFVNIAADTKKLGVEYDDVTNSSQALNAALGTASSMISGDILSGMSVFEKRMKMSREATVGLAKIALALGKTTKEIGEDALMGAQGAANEYGVRINYPQLMEKVGKISGRIRLIYADNMELMGKTVGKAQLLGLTMKDLESTSKSFLNFQSSIESEMKAELFLGKQLNLERARLAALTNDYATVQSEVLKNAGDFVDYSNMNALQQEALAEALGMSSDQVADMLLAQADLVALKEKATALGREDLANNLQQMSVNDAWAATMNQMKNIVMNMMAGIENVEISASLSALLGMGFQRTKLFDGMTKLAEKTTAARGLNKDTSIYEDNEITGQSRVPIVNDFSLGGLRLRTNPLDTFALVGGSAVDGTRANPPIQENPNRGQTLVVKQEKWDTAKFDFDTTKFNS